MSIVGNRNWHKILWEEKEDPDRLLDDYRSLNKFLDKILKVLEDKRR